MTSKELPNKLPPQAIEAEQSLLGCLILDKNSIIKVADFLKPQDFYKKIHSEIYSACQELFEKGEPIDLLSCSNRLKEKGKIKDIGGNSYLTELVNSVPTSSHILNYAKIIQKKSILRDLINTSYEIRELGYSEDKESDLLLDKAEQKIFSIAQRNLSQKFLPIKESLGSAWERIEKLSEYKGELRGLATGFTALDNKLAGLQKSDLIILAARPSIGKSTLALNIGTHVAINEKVPVGIFSLEMSKDQLVDKLIADQAGIDLWKIRTGKLSGDGDDNDFSRIQQSMSLLSEASIYIDDTSSSSVLQMKALARRLQAKKGLGLIIIDYLQLMESRNNNVSLVQQMTEISKSLKIMAKELNVPVLALSQLSRAVEQRAPQIPRLADLRESGSLEQDADVVLFIYREDKYRQDSTRKNIADIHIAKHRNGPTGKIELFFDENKVAFRNLEKNYSEELPQQ